MIIFFSVTITVDNLDVSSKGKHEIYRGNYGVKQTEIRIENKNA